MRGRRKRILRSEFHKAGWMFLIEFYGYATLFEINQDSGWFDCSHIEEFQHTDSRLEDLSYFQNVLCVYK